MTKLAIYFFCALLFLTCGCKPSNQSHTPTITSPQPPILFDQVLTREDVIRRLKLAEQNLATDSWHTNPMSGSFNVSRSKREVPISDDILREIQPYLEKMSASELLAQLKVFPMLSSPSIDGVAYYVYDSGNKKIIDLFEKRPQAEFESLRKFKDDTNEVFTGPQGDTIFIRDLVRQKLLKQE